MDFPVIREFIEGNPSTGKFSTTIYSHGLPVHDGSISCWTYVSSGFASINRPELVMTIQRKQNELPRDIPDEPQAWFEFEYDQACKGTPSHSVGDRWGMNSGNFFSPQMIGVLFQKAQQLPTIEIPERSLCLVPITREEHETAKEFGYLRVLALLAERFNHYPYPPWFDSSRESVVTSDQLHVMRTSMFARSSLVVLSGVSVMQFNSDLIFVLKQEASKFFREFFKLAPERLQIVRFSLDLDDRADACLTWQPHGSDHLKAVARLQSGIYSQLDDKWLAGTFVVIVNGMPNSAYEITEDGFSLMLTTEDWISLKSALKTGEPLQIQFPNGTSLKLIWQ